MVIHKSVMGEYILIPKSDFITFTELDQCKLFTMTKWVSADCLRIQARNLKALWNTKSRTMWFFHYHIVCLTTHFKPNFIYSSIKMLVLNN